jgi:hypothetical protein
MTEKEKKKFEKINPKDFQVDVEDLKDKTQQIVSQSTEKMKKFRI